MLGQFAEVRGSRLLRSGRARQSSCVVSANVATPNARIGVVIGRLEYWVEFGGVRN
jgi:hypothetical protein